MKYNNNYIYIYPRGGGRGKQWTLCHIMNTCNGNRLAHNVLDTFIAHFRGPTNTADIDQTLFKFPKTIRGNETTKPRN